MYKIALVNELRMRSKSLNLMPPKFSRLITSWSKSVNTSSSGG